MSQIKLPEGTIHFRESGKGPPSSSSTACWSTAGSGAR